MTQARAEWIRWGLLFGLIYLAVYVIENISNAIVPWVVTCVLQILGFLHAPESVIAVAAWGGVFGALAIRFIAAGFIYCWIMGETWKRSAVQAWLAVTALDHLLVLPYAGTGIFNQLRSPMFYAMTAAACAASFCGARLGARHRSNEHLREFRERLLERFALERP